MKFKLLFVDDESNILSSLRREFKDSDYISNFASGPTEALEFLKEGDYAVIITDMGMPVMNGVELLNLVKQLYPEVVRIVLSGYSDKEIIIKAVNQGNIFQYLIKPCDTEDLKIVIAQAVDYYKNQQERQLLFSILSNETNELKKKNFVLSDELINQAKLIVEQQKQLQDSYERLKSLDKNKSEFISLVSHELRTPLSILIGYLDILRYEKMESKDISSSRINDIFKVLDESTNRLHNIILNILMVMKLESPAPFFSFIPLNISDLILSTVSNFQFFAQKKNIKLNFTNNAGVDLPQIAVDKNKIQLAIENLMQNAIDFTDNNGNVEICLDNYTENDIAYIKISIKDTGCGILPEKLDKIWDKFSCGGNILNHSKGIGLGLSITRKIIEGHSGKIWVNSEVSKGSEFSFILPLLLK